MAKGWHNTHIPTPVGVLILGILLLGTIVLISQLGNNQDNRGRASPGDTSTPSSAAAVIADF